jgi:hypothetical protein
LLDLYNLFDRIGFLYFFFIFFFIFIARTNDWLDFKISAKHERKFLSHSPISPLLILICFLIGSLFSFISIFIGIYLGFIVYIIFFMHFLLDALNPSGVPLLPNSRININSIPYDDLKSNIFLLFIGLLMIFIAILGFLILA